MIACHCTAYVALAITVLLNTLFVADTVTAFLCYGFCTGAGTRSLASVVTDAVTASVTVTAFV